MTRNFKFWLILVLFPFLFQSCMEYKDINFKGVKNVAVQDRSSEKMKLEIAVLIDNPNTYNIKVKKSSLDIYLNGKYAGKTTLDQKVVIKKKSENVYYAVINVSTKDLMKAAMGSIGGLLKGTATVELKGKVKGSVYGISKSMDVDMKQEVNLKDFMP